MTTAIKIDGDNWTAFDADGYITARGVAVAVVDDTVGIGAGQHRLDELTISDDGKRIESQAGWFLTREAG